MTSSGAKWGDHDTARAGLCRYYGRFADELHAHGCYVLTYDIVALNGQRSWRAVVHIETTAPRVAAEARIASTTSTHATPSAKVAKGTQPVGRPSIAARQSSHSLRAGGSSRCRNRLRGSSLGAIGSNSSSGGIGSRRVPARSASHASPLSTHTVPRVPATRAMAEEGRFEKLEFSVCETRNSPQWMYREVLWRSRVAQIEGHFDQLKRYPQFVYQPERAH